MDSLLRLMLQILMHHTSFEQQILSGTTLSVLIRFMFGCND